MKTKQERSKATAIILAVFLTYWTWLYTYDADKTKFWTGLALSIVGVFLCFLPNIGVWIWAIVDTASNSERKRIYKWN